MEHVHYLCRVQRVGINQLLGLGGPLVGRQIVVWAWHCGLTSGGGCTFAERRNCCKVLSVKFPPIKDWSGQNLDLRSEAGLLSDAEAISLRQRSSTLRFAVPLLNRLHGTDRE